MIFTNLKRIPAALIFISSLLLGSNAVFAVIDPQDGHLDMGEYLANNAYGFLPIPIVITEPAVGVGGGVLGMFLHESEEEQKARKQQALTATAGDAQLLAPSITVAGGAYTDNGTWMAVVGHRHTWNNDSIRYLGGAGYGRANIDVYKRFDLTLPTNSPLSGSLGIATESEGFLMKHQVEFRIPDSDLFLGVSQTYSSFSTAIKSIDLSLSGDEWQLPTIDNSLDSSLSGVGIVAEYDTRNNLFFPTSGSSVKAEYLIYDELIGSDFDFSTFEVDAFQYVPVSEKLTLAFAGSYTSLHTQEHYLPPLSQPYIDMRGVAAYKYQGNEVSTLQVQTMWHLNHRWTINAFYGVGSSASEHKELFSDSVSAYGLGFRYQIARRYGIHVGVDVAYSEDQATGYFQVGTGF
ncbi:BamA/TamA family outer membrane protein [Vibrio methylphosphonaticus]|uniref:BamA/TamA family outer membrane protein n=1 Tax=Vibrio methylphosphonaticus TaxID=2946866 RepID=UPI002029B5FF|nr:BamA/TamA family outer membrane protein [Vibrio methylphosphonaticus]MCL9773919.1 BamA/TamA family outer membrane protein [Vibrio methylphosphonaticus]